ncbi:multiple sugar transport system permease protein/raffinose/stachyose/melibiose transport system permease protein [Motilibacter peucedani]|uniref:Multiple sugar transport system permease protein/raffinose/stachyose/melibiose transport system permease protein n=1 Tax=Motilibacter peucedani TaxID=598650 RepID=A0A420XQA8_9ACTN|nr:sugar ABC transporter permease [Motilibacter peucedani]RKS75473.1 multiple sugar transport system permease protein/raffinose/stachyose/melibiose transport system permease protein [Motilibacter peucedani]
MTSVFGDKRSIALLLGPALLFYSLVMLLPMLWSLGYTFFNGSVITGFDFAGLANFRKLFDDPALMPAIWFTVKYAVCITVGQVLMGYGLSLLYLFFLKHAGGVIRTLVFFPVVLPTVAVSLLFQKFFEYAPQTGPVNSLLDAVGIGGIDWFGSAGKAFVVIAIMDIWRSMGFYAVLLYAGLLDIPDELIESAALDGANGWRLIKNIIIPLSLPVLVSSVVFSINGTLKAFDSIYALTGGGPGTSTTPLTLYMFQTSFSYGDYGYGATVALTLTLICLLVTVVIFRATRRDTVPR